MNSKYYLAIFIIVFIFHAEKSLALSSSNVRSLFDQYLSENENSIESESLSGDSLKYYDTSYYLNGLLSAAEGTKDEAILIKAIHYIDNMLAQASDLNADGHLEWDLIGNQPGQLDHFQGSVPIARAASIILNIPEFRNKYQAKADQYIAFIDNSIFSYWFDKYTGIYFVGDDSYPGYEFNYYGEIPWVQQKYGGGIRFYTPKIWSDKGALVGTIAAYMYKATKELKYEEFASRIGMEFKDRLKVNGTGWVWSNDQTLGYWQTNGYDKNKEPVHDTSHANREPSMMIAMYEAGVKYKSNPVFTESDIIRMANTLTDFIWNGSLTQPRFSNYINGVNVGFGEAGPSVVGNIYDGWSMLGKYSPKVKEVAIATLEGVSVGQVIGQNNSSYGKIALSGNILRYNPPTPTPTPISTPTITPTPIITTTPIPPSIPTPTPIPTIIPTPLPSNIPIPTYPQRLIRFFNDSKVYELRNNKLIWISSLEVFNTLGLSWAKVETLPLIDKNLYIRAKLLRAVNDPKVYYITESGMKRWIPTEQVFLSYNNKWEDVITVQPIELNTIPDNTLVRVPGDSKVYQIQGVTKRWIKTAEAFTRNNFYWTKISPINQTELDFYITGDTIN